MPKDEIPAKNSIQKFTTRVDSSLESQVGITNVKYGVLMMIFYRNQFTLTFIRRSSRALVQNKL